MIVIKKRSPPSATSGANKILSQKAIAFGGRGSKAETQRKPRLFDSALGMEKKQTFEMEVSKVR